ncbi:leucine-rich repeat domain-containing protein [uncultured Treponema sp.]|uniref:leucine-rich repeat domain-containing protein n=1 Tax=uncultured Treponema sp. TaxID=162155 RepID=UPI0025F85496|nr:leucine-rich repeat domain-containing protein [uncultured Treponema sp.]
MKKYIFLILPAVMLMLASCMDSASGNGGAGSVLVALPGSSRNVSSSGRADSYTVSLLKGGKVIESQTAVPGGAVEFNELDAGSYTVDVEATLSGALSGVGSAEVAVTEGETASCSVLMNRVYTAAQAAERISDNNGENWNIIVAGPIDDDGLLEIAKNLKDVLTEGCISLDLGRTTGLSSIGVTKFQNCTALSAIVLPEGIGSIDENAFDGCTSLASVTIPDTVNEIGQFAFRNCSALKSIEIPNSVTTIAIGAFRDCTALTSIEIPRGVITIGSDSFNGCTALESIEIPDSVTTIERAAFHGCSSLTDVYIPDSVTEIGNQTFTNCSNLKSIVLSTRITSIAEQVFRNCTALTSIEIPDGVSEIKSSAFMSCEVLESITIPVSVTSIETGAFVSCNKLKSVKYKGLSDDWSGIAIGSNNPFESGSSGIKIICSDKEITL